MDRDLIIKRLTKEYGYPVQGAGVVADKLLAVAPEVQEAFNEWWQKGTIPPLEIEHYTASRLMDEHGMNPVAAFLTLDWLVREPVKAEQSLKRGHDKVTKPD